MSAVSTEFITKYQKVLDEDPESKVFAPLAEAYRKIGQLDQAYKTAVSGLEHHPHFASGRVAMGKIHIDRGNWQEAQEELKKAAELSPDNLLAHQLLAQVCLNLKQPKKALAAYKMVLFLSPEHAEAKKVIKKLESLTADEYESEAFEFVDLHTPTEPSEKIAPSSAQKNRLLERALSLADAHTIRGDIAKAQKVLEETHKDIGAHPELTKRLSRIADRNQLPKEASGEEVIRPISRRRLALEERQKKLEILLKKVIQAKETPLRTP